jgi:pimeloyl-ACP methyl ester carboxylesterase
VRAAVVSLPRAAPRSVPKSGKVFPEGGPVYERIGQLWLERKPPVRAPARGRVLLVHGMWGGSWYWGYLLRRFAEAGWDAWAVNLRGHHGSDPGAEVGGLSVRDYVADVTRCVAELGEVVLIGHSLGGLVAQKAAEQVPLRAAVFVTSAPPRGIPALHWPMLRRLGRYGGAMLANRAFVPSRADADVLLFNNLAPDVRRDAYARLVPESGRAAREVALGLVAVDPACVRCPTLVVGAGRDAITPCRVQRRIAAKYGSEYRELPRRAHMLMLEDGWEAVADELLDWLAQVAS